MLLTIDYKKTLEDYDNYIFVDVRSPKEFNDSSIPGAISIPLLNDEQRAEVGTLYKQQSKKDAVKVGINYVSKSLPEIYERVLNICEKPKNIVIFCARGGMRSESITGLLKSLGLPVLKLNGGYKEYRAYIREILPLLIEEFDFVTLYGKTGTGKTNILKEIQRMGHDIIDLEGCANHRGSLLGSIGIGKCNSQKQFESLVFDSLRYAENESNVIFTEGESKRIGNIIMPEYMYNKLISSRKLLIEADINKRVNIVRNEYLQDSFDKSELIKTIALLGRYMSSDRVDDYLKHIEVDNFDYVIQDLMLNYYDNAYSTKEKYFEQTFINNDEEEISKEIVNYILTNEKKEL